ncbi:MAG: TerB family tellurite resistance protein [Caulobacteraceae bacterium]
MNWPARPPVASRATPSAWPSATRRCPQLLEDVLEGLFHIAGSDGAITDHELHYLEDVGKLFGLPAEGLLSAQGDPHRVGP